MPEYDNNNRGSLFTPKSEAQPQDLSGTAELDHTKFYVDCYRCNGRVKAVLIFKECDNHDNLIVVPLRASDKGKCIMYGQLIFNGTKFTCNVFKNDPKSERSPVLQLSFLGKEAAVESAPQSSRHYDDIPF